jgi:hypothetical protein
MDIKIIIDALDKSLPPVFGRSAVGKLMPGIITSKTLANLACKGEGPPTFKAGSKAILEKNTFLPWLAKRFGK